jgi:hypothetical protein
MIEIEGGSLLAVDTLSTQMMALLTEANGEAAASSGAAASRIYGDEILLSERRKKQATNGSSRSF